MERRKFARVPLDAPQFINLEYADFPPMTTMLIDISKGGLQAAFSPNQQGGLDWLLGKNVVVKNLPAPVQRATGTTEGHHGVITWLSPERCGVQFDSALEIDEEELAALVEDM